MERYRSVFDSTAIGRMFRHSRRMPLRLPKAPNPINRFKNVPSCSRATNRTGRHERPDDRARGADTRHEGLNIRGNTVHSE
jgi:hypothetical protein